MRGLGSDQAAWPRGRPAAPAPGHAVALHPRQPAVWCRLVQWRCRPHRYPSEMLAGAATSLLAVATAQQAAATRAPPNPAVNSVQCLHPDGTRSPCGPGNQQCGMPFPLAPRYHVMDPSCIMNVRATRCCHCAAATPCPAESRRAACRIPTARCSMPSTESTIYFSRTTSPCPRLTAAAPALSTATPRPKIWRTGHASPWRSGTTTVTTASPSTQVCANLTSTLQLTAVPPELTGVA